MMTRRFMVRAERIEKLEAMLAQFPKEVEVLLKAVRTELVALLSESVVVERKDAGQSDEAKRRRAQERQRASRALRKVDG